MQALKSGLLISIIPGSRQSGSFVRSRFSSAGVSIAGEVNSRGAEVSINDFFSLQADGALVADMISSFRQHKKHVTK